MKITIKIGFFFGLLGFLFPASSWAAGSDSFLTTITTQKDAILTMYDSGYARVYQKFQLTGASIMGSLNYQSLVCLGVINNGSFLANMQNDLKILKTNFLNQYTTVLTSFLELEQKKHLYEDSKVNLFSSGSYESDLLALSGLYTQILSQQSVNVVNFQNKYLQSLSTFISDYINYTKKNKDLISKVSSKILLLQNINTSFSLIKGSLDNYLLGLGTLSKSPIFSNTSLVKNASISLLDANLNKKLLAQTKRYKILKTLSGSLLTQKDILLSRFSSEYDSVYDAFLGNWYNNTSYNKLKSKLDSIYSLYYSGSLYQCAPILSSTSFDTDVATLFKELKQFSGSLSSGYLHTGSFSLTGFQKKLNSWLSNLQTKQNALSAEYTTFINTTTNTLLEEYKRSNELSQNAEASSGSSTVSNIESNPSSLFVAPLAFSFTAPFTLNQKHSDIAILQGLLSSLGYYTGAIDSVYSSSTKSAVHHFQLDKGLLKGYEKKPQTWGWMGPATRGSLNTLLH